MHGKLFPVLQSLQRGRKEHCFKARQGRTDRAYTSRPYAPAPGRFTSGESPISLADFIEENIERLQDEWTEFARTREPAGTHVPTEALTNGSKELLLDIAADLRTEQSADFRVARSRGKADSHTTNIARSANEHAEQRLRDGFTLDQLVSEYRALRASVVRSWPGSLTLVDRSSIDELKRFNDAMDESLSMAVRYFNRGTEQARDIFIGILSHDFRSPLGAAVNGNHLQRLYRTDVERFEDANDRVARSLERMTRMIDDLLDFSRTRMGRPLSLTRRSMDLAQVCRDTLDLIASIRPGREIRLEGPPILEGRWDPDRVAQLLTNLVSNAIRHGDTDRPVTVTVRADDESVRISVHNRGKPIPYERQHIIFDPFRSGLTDGQQDGAYRDSLGLGLYIARSIAEAHGGTISVDSSPEQGTTFTARLPKGE